LKDLEAEAEVDLDKTNLVSEIKKRLSVMGERRIVFAKQ
jgi:hypothetical protein